jgi:hypothetical protein
LKRYKFVGEEPVDVPSLHLVDVQPGDVVEVENPALSEGLDGQANWEHIPDPQRSKAAKKAAVTRADDQED